MKKRYKVGVEVDVLKAMRRFPKKKQFKIWETIESLKKTPRPQGCKKLEDSEYRIWVGRDYRVVYIVDDEKREVLVTEAFTKETGY